MVPRSGLMGGKSGPQSHSPISEVPEKRVDASALPPPHPHGRYLLEIVAPFYRLHGRLNTDFVQCPFPANGLGDLLAEYLEAEGQVAQRRPEQELKHLLKDPIQDVLQWIVIRETAAGQPPIGNDAI